MMFVTRASKKLPIITAEMGEGRVENERNSSMVWAMSRTHFPGVTSFQTRPLILLEQCQKFRLELNLICCGDAQSGNVADDFSSAEPVTLLIV